MGENFIDQNYTNSFISLVEVHYSQKKNLQSEKLVLHDFSKNTDIWCPSYYICKYFFFQTDIEEKSFMVVDFKELLSDDGTFT